MRGLVALVALAALVGLASCEPKPIDGYESNDFWESTVDTAQIWLPWQSDPLEQMGQPIIQPNEDLDIDYGQDY